MEIFAAGFNAWHQLEFQHPHSTTEGSHDPSPQTTEPRDLHSFTKVIAANTLERPVAGLSYTLGTLLPEQLHRMSGPHPFQVLTSQHVSFYF